MDFEIVSVGTELLLGQIVNTNAQYLSQQLSDLGFNVFYTTVVGDNPERLKEALRLASQRADAVITTGGLGPTGDDLTKETIAAFCGRRCVMHEESKRRIVERFQNTGTYMPENNLKQAEMPEECIVLRNDHGTAPGAIIEDEKAVFIMLPGPPSEMKPMFDTGVRPYLEKLADCVIISRSLRVFGIGESAAEEQLKDLLNEQSNPTLAPYAKTGEVELRLTAKATDAAAADKLLDPLEEKVRAVLGDKVYGMGADITLQEVVVRLLCEKNMRVATAESCTGGMIAEKITTVPGASACFDCGFVTYSNAQKQRLLGVRAETLEAYGAVSEQTALEMCKGAKAASGADVAVSVTGIAGPDGGTAEKPVGLVYIGICADNVHRAYRFHLAGDRDMVRARSSLYALDLVRRWTLGILNQDAAYVW